MIQVRAAVNVLVAHFSGKKVKANSPQAILDAERDANMSIAKVCIEDTHPHTHTHNTA